MELRDEKNSQLNNRLPKHFAEPNHTLSSLMWTVVIALLPGVAASVFFFGVGIILQLAVSLLTVVASDELSAKLKHQEFGSSSRDGSAVVLACIVAISMPPYAHWWMCASAAIVANIFGKHIYGGTGQNLFNPAMVGVVFALVCFPSLSAYWPNASGTGTLSMGEIFKSFLSMQSNLPDVISGATLLEYERTQLSFAVIRGEFSNIDQYGLFAERGWEWVNFAYLIGGLWLCARRVINWVVPVFVLGTVFVFASICHGVDETRFAGPFIHCFSGAIIICAFFVATDPVSSPAGQRPIIIYAILIGLFVFVLRHVGVYPEAVAFSVIIANALSPLLDRLFARQIYGH